MFHSAEYTYHPSGLVNLVPAVATLSLATGLGGIPKGHPLNGFAVSDTVARLGFFRSLSFSSPSSVAAVRLRVEGYDLSGAISSVEVTMPAGSPVTFADTNLFSSVTSITQLTDAPANSFINVSVNPGGFTPWFELDAYVSTVAALQISEANGVFQPIFMGVIRDFHPSQIVYDPAALDINYPRYSNLKTMTSSTNSYANTFAQGGANFVKYVSVLMTKSGAQAPTGSCVVNLFQPRLSM